MTHSELDSIGYLTTLYKASKQRFDSDVVFQEKARRLVVSLQSGDGDCRRIWTKLCDLSRREFQRVYDLLDVSLTEMGESFYNPFIPAVINELKDKGLVSVDQGMDIVRLSDYPIPLILRKSDGGYGYDSTDMTAVKYRLFDLQRDWVIVITDAGQNLHFQLVYEAARQAGWVSRKSTPRSLSVLECVCYVSMNESGSMNLPIVFLYSCYVSTLSLSISLCAMMSISSI